jgi:hypothetical protein
MIFQWYPELILPMREGGCYILSIMWHAVIEKRLRLDVAQVNAMYEAFVIHGYIHKDCTVLLPQSIFRFLGFPVRYTDKHERPTRLCRPHEIEILCFEHPKYGTHFTAGNGQGVVTYDSWGRSVSAREGTLVSKRIFERVA